MKPAANAGQIGALGALPEGAPVVVLVGRANAGMNGAVGLWRLFDRFHLLQVLRHNDAGDFAVGLGDAHGAVDEVPDLRW